MVCEKFVDIKGGKLVETNFVYHYLGENSSNNSQKKNASYKLHGVLLINDKFSIIETQIFLSVVYLLGVSYFYSVQYNTKSPQKGIYFWPVVFDELWSTSFHTFLQTEDFTLFFHFLLMLLAIMLLRCYMYIFYQASLFILRHSNFQVYSRPFIITYSFTNYFEN